MYWRSDIKPESGPFKVLLERGEFVDESRQGRAVPYKIYYPIEHDIDALPVIVWSHGFGGNRDGASFLSRYIASHGYVLVHLTHRGTDSSLWEGKPGHPWDILREIKIPREASLNRFADVPFVLDQLPRWGEGNPEIGRHVDFSNIGMSGHSFGSLTTQVMAGQLFPNEDERLISLREERFKAGILYSPVPIAHLTGEDPADIYGPVDIPLFHMTGTQDDSPLEGHGYEKRLVIHDHSSHPDKHLLVLKEGDHMVFAGSRGKLAKNPLRDQHEEIIKISSLAFWESYLKNDKSAKEWLTKDGLSHYIASHE